jgi:hypothetical protein
MPKIGKCLTQVEFLDMALRDWREINRLFASPVPVIECKDANEVAKVSAANPGANWKQRRLVIIAGKLYYVTPPAGNSEALDKEIVSNVKMISGTTGVPVHFLGLPDLMSNRATADNLMELVAASTSKERQIWGGTYYEILEKAMVKRNAETKIGARLDPKKVKVIIPYVTEAAWQKIIDVYLPLYTNGAISLETLLSQVPGMDVDAEIERSEEREAKALERFKARAEEDDEDEEDEEKP